MEPESKSRIGKIVAVFERATIPQLNSSVKDIQAIQPREGEVLTAIYLAAKLAYARVKAKDETLSEMANALIHYHLVKPDELLRFMDHECSVVLHCEKRQCVHKSEGYRKIMNVLKVVAKAGRRIQLGQDVPDTVAVAVLSSFKSAKRLFQLDDKKLVQMVTNMYTNVLPKLEKANIIPGGPDGNDENDNCSVLLVDSNTSAMTESLLNELPPEMLHDEFVLCLKKVRNPVQLCYAMIRSGRIDAKHALYLLNTSAAKRRDTFDTYLKKVGDLADDPGDIKRPHEVKSRDAPGDSWTRDSCDRDLFVLEKFMDEGPWHNLDMPELDLLCLAIRSGNWVVAKSLIELLNIEDLAAHPPIAKALINLAFAMISGVVDMKNENGFKDGLKRAELLSNNGYGLVKPLKKREQVWEINSDFVEILLCLGAHARRSLPFLFALCNLLRGQDISTNVGAFQIMEKVVLPALNLCTSNAALSNKIWKVLKRTDSDTRWNLYRSVRENAPEKWVEVKVFCARAEWETRSVTKRVTTSSFIQFRETMAKMLHCQAPSVCAAFIRRIQGYPPDRKTLTPYMETLTLGTSLAFDIMAAQIVEQLDSERKRIKEDGYNFEAWFASMSLLIGIFLRMIAKEPATVEGIMLFLKRKICVEEQPDFVSVLKDIILCTTDIDVERSLTTRQQQAKGGGKYIRTVVHGKLDSATVTSVPGKILDREEDRRCKHSSCYLKRALLNTGTNYLFGVGIAKFASKTGGESGSAKNISGKRDRVRGALLQYSHLLDYLDGIDNGDKQKDQRSDELEQKQDIVIKRENGGKDKKDGKNSEEKDDAVMNDGNEGDSKVKKEEDIIVVDGGKESVVKQEVLMMDGNENEKKVDKIEDDSTAMDETPKDKDQEEEKKDNAKDENAMQVVVAKEKKDIWMQFKTTSLKEVKEMGIVPYLWFALLRPVLSYPEGLQIVKDWAMEADTLYKPELARTFWTLHLPDLEVPRELYLSELKRLSALVKRWKEAYRHLRERENKASNSKTYSDFNYRRRCADYELRRFETLEKAVSQERNVVHKRTIVVGKHFKEHAKELGEGILNLETSERQTLIQSFADKCIIPRALSSAVDAIYCVRFVFKLNTINDEVLDLPELVKYIISKACDILVNATEADASNFGVAVRELLTMMDSWRSNKSAFDTDRNHGFRGKDGSLWRHEVYCNWAFEQHATLTAGLCKLLESSEYLNARNALALLHIVAGTFPKVEDHGNLIAEAVRKLTKSDKEDLRLTAIRVVGALEADDKTRVPVHIFKLKIKKPSEPREPRGTKRDRSPDIAGPEFTKSPKFKDAKSPAEGALVLVEGNPKRARSPDGERDESNAKRGRRGREKITDRLGGKLNRVDNRNRGDDRRRRSADGPRDGPGRDERMRDGDDRKNEQQVGRRDGDERERRQDSRHGRTGQNRRGNEGHGRTRDGEEHHRDSRRGGGTRDDEERHRDSRRGNNRNADTPARGRDGDDYQRDSRRGNNNRNIDTPARGRDGDNHQRDSRRGNNNRNQDARGRDGDGHQRDSRRGNNNRNLDTPLRGRDGDDNKRENRRGNNNRNPEAPARGRDGDERQREQRRASGNRGNDAPQRGRDDDDRQREPRRGSGSRDVTPRSRDGDDYQRRGNHNRNTDTPGRSRDGDESQRRGNDNRNNNAPGRPRDNDDHQRRASVNRSNEPPVRGGDDDGHLRESRRGDNRKPETSVRGREGDDKRDSRPVNDKRNSKSPVRPRDGEDQQRESHRGSINRDNEENPRVRDGDENQPEGRRSGNNRGNDGPPRGGRDGDEHPRDMNMDEHPRHRFDNRRGRGGRDDRNFDNRDMAGWDGRDNRRRHSDEGDWNNNRYRHGGNNHGQRMGGPRNNRYGGNRGNHPMDGGGGGGPHRRYRDRYHQQNDRRDDGPPYEEPRQGGGNYARRRQHRRPGGHQHRR